MWSRSSGYRPDGSVFSWKKVGSAGDEDGLRVSVTRDSCDGENRSIVGLTPGMSRASARRLMPWLGRGFVLICQGASKLNGIGTLLQPNDQPVLQCPHVSETSGETLAGLSGTPRIAAEGDDAFA